jgi:hypothetical protein
MIVEGEALERISAVVLVYPLGSVHCMLKEPVNGADDN